MVVVIGASGFLGSHLLCHLVQSNDKVRALYRNKQSIAKAEHYLQYYNLPNDLFKEKVEWIQADVLDVDSLNVALHGATFVYNCSGYISFDKRDRNMMIAVNATGTSNIVNACLMQGCKKLVHVSSIAALGDTNTEEPVTEETQWLRSATESWYSITKFNAETEVWRGFAEGLSIAIVNPSVIIGPGNWNQGSPKLYKTVYDGLQFYTKGISGFVDVRDVCCAMVRLMQSSIDGQRFVVSGSNQSYRDLFSGIAKGIHKPLPKYNASPAILSIAWRFDLVRSVLTGKTPLISKNTARTAITQSYYSSQKLIDALSFMFTPFDETIRFTANCFLNDLTCFS